MLKIALVSVSLFLLSGIYSGAQAARQCGCEAKCPEGFTFHAIKTGCRDEHQACNTHADNNKCEITCKKDGAADQTIPGTCHEIYYRPVSGLKYSPRNDRK